METDKRKSLYFIYAKWRDTGKQMPYYSRYINDIDEIASAYKQLERMVNLAIDKATNATYLYLLKNNKQGYQIHESVFQELPENQVIFALAFDPKRGHCLPYFRFEPDLTLNWKLEKQEWLQIPEEWKTKMVTIREQRLQAIKERQQINIKYY